MIDTGSYIPFIGRMSSTVRLVGRLFVIDSLRGSGIRIKSGPDTESGEYSRHQKVPRHGKNDEG
jgi:hypothetical protein